MVSVAPEHLMLVSANDVIDRKSETRSSTDGSARRRRLDALPDRPPLLSRHAGNARRTMPRLLQVSRQSEEAHHSYIDKTMIKAGADQLELTDVAPRGATKHVAATAFYNCLSELKLERR